MNAADADRFWTNPFAMDFARVRDLLLVDHDGQVIEGRWTVNRAGFALRSEAAVRSCTVDLLVDQHIKFASRSHVGVREGAGEVVKLCNGLLYLTAVFCGIEALKLARAHGVDEQTVFEVASSGTGNSWYVQNPHFLDDMMLSHPHPEDLAKDVWEAVKAAKEADLQLVIGGAVAMISPRLSRERRADLLARLDRPDG